VKILDSFLNGEWLWYHELFGLATNLNYVNGGLKLMKDTMLKYNKSGETKYTENNFNILKYLRKYNYKPQPVYTFSKYSEDQDVYDIITASKGKRGKIEIIDPINKISLKEAENTFHNKINEIITNGKEGEIYILKLPTAIGKTEILTTLTGVISTPTNNLKNEITNRMKIPHEITPDQIELSEQTLNKKIEYYHKIGDYQNAIAVIHDVSKSGNTKYSIDDVEKANRYLNQLQKSYTTNLTVVTTHNRAIHSKFKHDTIIFDEDPLKSILEVKQMDLTDLRKIQYEISNNSDLNNIIEYLESQPKNAVIQTPEFNVDIKELIENISVSSIQSNIFEFFNSKYFVRDGENPHIIHYVNINSLPRDKKIIILSATIPLFIYQKMYGDRIKIIEIKDVVHQGTIRQYTKRSCSRNALKHYIKDISDSIGEKPVITFKSYSNQFRNPIKDMYFGNCSGYDTLKGRDLVVVGTPHRNPIEYILLAKLLGIEFSTNDLMLDDQYVEYNGIRFLFKTYKNEGLRNIQLSLIESELIQAVGRARALRTNVLVEIYSNFPLRITSEFM
jgi:hypothetical protein